MSDIPGPTLAADNAPVLPAFSTTRLDDLEPVPSTPQETFRAKRAFAIFLAYLGAQVAVMIAGLIVIEIALRPRHMAKALAPYLGLIVLAMLISSALVTVALAMRWAGPWLRDRSLAGVGPLHLSFRRSGTAVLCGLAMGAACTALLSVFPSPHHTAGILEILARSGSVNRLILALIAVLLAPPTEELLFRGLLLRGFTASWGVIPAAIAVTLLFTVLHLDQLDGYWLATLMILSLGVAALITRLKAGLLAAVLVHASFNFAMMLFLYARGDF